MNQSNSLTLIGIEAALLAGEKLKQGFGSRLSISYKKGVHNLVTQYDRLSEKTIVDFISRYVPESQFLAEESGKSGKTNAKILWIIDPLDGTVNFAHKIPFFCVSIAAYMEGKTILGIVFHPLTHELFVAERGRGAYLNGEKIHVTKTAKLEKSILATGFPYDVKNNPSHCIERFSDVIRLGVPIRRLGSAALDLAYTAAGRFDGFFESILSPWDSAAGNLLVEEAGGKISHWDNKKYDLFAGLTLLATNGLIHNQLSKILIK
jgi:myo-inositol-1(or 4)-monophosphatase